MTITCINNLKECAGEAGGPLAYVTHARVVDAISSQEDPATALRVPTPGETVTGLNVLPD